MQDLNEIKAWLLENQANPLKKFSQNFLIEKNWTLKIALEALAEAEAIWEIGPGLGALTTQIHKNTTVPITVFEIDKKYSEYLRKIFPNITLIEGDFLKSNLRISNEKTVLVSNLPYHISSQILFKILDSRLPFSKLVFMFQREFAQRLRAKPRSKEYGILTILFQSFYHINSLGVVSKNCFYPAPSVDSEVLIFTPKAYSGPDFSMLKEVTHVAFAHRRKKLISNLKEKFPSQDWKTLFSEMALSENARAEELDLEQFWKLAAFAK